jgi:S1-C subfamily serine protease
MQKRSSSRLILIGLLFCSNVSHAERYVSTGRYGNDIDLDSFVKRGDLVQFDIRRLDSNTGSRAVSVVQESFLVNCFTRERGAITGNPRTIDFQPVASDTPSSVELDIACENLPPPNTPAAMILGEVSTVSPPLSAKRTNRARSPQRRDPEAASPSPATVEQPVPTGAVQPKPKSTGSGFIIAPGMVITNDHVSRGCSRLRVRRGPEYFDGSVVTATQRNDLALLKVDGLSVAHIPGIRTTAQLGEEITTAGHPLSGLLSSDLIVTSGQVNALSGIADDPTLIQISSPVQPGNSGGPLIDHAGNIVGVIVSKLNAGNVAKLTGDVAQNVNFAIKAEMLKLFLDSARVNYRPVGYEKQISNIKVAQLARDFTVKIECY